MLPNHHLNNKGRDMQREQLMHDFYTEMIFLDAVDYDFIEIWNSLRQIIPSP